MRVKRLTDLLWAYTGAAKRNETENTEILRLQFFELFGELMGPEENRHQILRIREKIVCDMERNSFDDEVVASYTRDLLVYGFR